MNLELAKLVWKQVTEFPETFYMGCWAGEREDCGTVACLAGHTMLLSGYSLREDARQGMPSEMRFIRPDGSRVGNPETEGIALLELTREEYAGEGWPHLFYDTVNGLSRFRRLIERAQE